MRSQVFRILGVRKFRYVKGFKNWKIYATLSLTRRRGEVDSIVFHLRFLTHSACQSDATLEGKSLASLVQISKEYPIY